MEFIQLNVAWYGYFCRYRSRDYVKQNKQKTENQTTIRSDQKIQCFPVPAERPQGSPTESTQEIPVKMTSADTAAWKEQHNIHNKDKLHIINKRKQKPTSRWLQQCISLNALTSREYSIQSFPSTEVEILSVNTSNTGINVDPLQFQKCGSLSTKPISWCTLIEHCTIARRNGNYWAFHGFPCSK